MVTTLFDLKTSAIWFIPLFLLLLINWFVKKQWLNKLSYGVGFLLAVAFLVYGFIGVFYYPLTKSIVGKEVFTIIGGQEAGIIFSYALEYWWAIILLLILAFFFVKGTSKIKLDLILKYKILATICFIMIWGLAARGSISLKPLNHLDAYANLEANAAVSSMTPIYVLLESINQEPLKEAPYLETAELNEFSAQFNKDYECDRQDSLNICIIILESFGLEYTGMNEAGAPSYTPFLDSLMTARSTASFNHAYANGLRSMDAISSIYSGVPCLMDAPFVGSLYAHNEIPSVLDRFKEMGYYTSFYHGADEQSMGFKPYLLSHGLDYYEGLQDYPDDKDYDGKWGIYDHAYLPYVAAQIDKMPQPFFTSVFTLSSHHPYTVPEEFSHLPKGELEIHQSVAYTDASLRSFFNKVKHSKWYENTLFVITADHSSINSKKMYQTRSGRYRVPLLFYLPLDEKPMTIHTPAQHIDIGPTLLNLVCYDKPFFSLGYNQRDQLDDPYVVHYEGGVYSVTSSEYSLEMSNGEPIALYNELKDAEHNKNLLKVDEDQRHINMLEANAYEMLHYLKAYIQNFNHRIITNTYH